MHTSNNASSFIITLGEQKLVRTCTWL